MAQEDPCRGLGSGSTESSGVVRGVLCENAVPSSSPDWGSGCPTATVAIWIGSLLTNGGRRLAYVDSESIYHRGIVPWTGICPIGSKRDGSFDCGLRGGVPLSRACEGVNTRSITASTAKEGRRAEFGRPFITGNDITIGASVIDCISLKAKRTIQLSCKVKW